jgi:hypothetical protein
MSNYRPISLLTTFSKIMERGMLNRLSKHLQVNKILTPGHFVFREGCIIDNAVYMLTDDTLTALNERRQIADIFCDLVKAFNCLNDDILVHKLMYYGIWSTAILWFKSYLENRKQKVEILHSKQGNFFFFFQI